MPVSVLRRLIIIAAVLLSLSAAGAAPSPQRILDRASAHFAAVTDYSADASVTVKSKTVHIPKSRVRIFFKKPDKVIVKSREGFAMLPRQGVLAGDPLINLRRGAKLKLLGTKSLFGVSCFVVSGMQEEDGRQIKWTVWVDRKSWLPRQIITEFGQGSATRANLWYMQAGKGRFMPSRTVVEVQPPSEGGRGACKDTLIVEVNFSNYKINTGIDDKVFNVQGGCS